MALARRHCAARVIAVSEAARRIYLERRWDRPERVVVVRNGVAAEPAARLGRRAACRVGIAPDEVLVAMVSRLGAEKGHDVALAAVALARRRYPGLRLVIVGDGDQRGQIQRAAATLDGAVIVTGYRDDVMEVLDAADLLLHPSRFDAFPTALLEAMAASVPVLASATGGIVEIVADGETGDSRRSAPGGASRGARARAPDRRPCSSPTTGPCGTRALPQRVRGRRMGRADPGGLRRRRARYSVARRNGIVVIDIGLFTDSQWQMAIGQRAALEGLLAQLKPESRRRGGHSPRRQPTPDRCAQPRSAQLRSEVRAGPLALRQRGAARR